MVSITKLLTISLCLCLIICTACSNSFALRPSAAKNELSTTTEFSHRLSGGQGPATSQANQIGRNEINGNGGTVQEGILTSDIPLLSGAHTIPRRTTHRSLFLRIVSRILHSRRLIGIAMPVFALWIAMSSCLSMRDVSLVIKTTQRPVISAALEQRLSLQEIERKMLGLAYDNINNGSDNAFFHLFSAICELAALRLEGSPQKALMFKPDANQQGELFEFFSIFSRADLFPMHRIKMLAFTPQSDGSVIIDIEFKLAEDEREMWQDGPVKFYLHEYEGKDKVSQLWLPEGNIRIIYIPYGYIEQTVYMLGFPTKTKIKIEGPMLQFDEEFVRPRPGGTVADVFGNPYIRAIMLIKQDTSTDADRNNKTGKIGIHLPGIQHVEINEPLSFGVKSKATFNGLYEKIQRYPASRPADEHPAALDVPEAVSSNIIYTRASTIAPEPLSLHIAEAILSGA